jgi:polyisoprenyl-teichoic acid--peptidoglycan teichoic acid transferase
MRRRTSFVPKKRGTDGWSRALTIFAAVSIIGGLICGYLVYSTIRDVVASSGISLGPSLPDTRVVQAQSEESPAQPEKQERINILLLGIDRREIEQGPCRTDTMIVLSVDPETKTAAMLSIPRDLWVLIPDYNENNRINSAHLLGDARDYPGGGPALAMKTVQYTLGIPIHNYVRINFAGFQTIIDELGGITINVEAPIHDEKFPDENFGYMTVDIPAGVQKMDGLTALQYARVRHGSSDFHRARRQQQVLLAIKDKALSLDIPLTNLPGLLRALENTMDTDLNFSQLEYLARLARDLRPENIRSAVIDESLARSTITPQGWDVLVADRDAIRQLVDELFPDPVATVHPEGAPVDMLIEEAARLDVLNGTVAEGLAERTATYLSKQGYQVVTYSNADRYDYRQTIIIDYASKPYTVNSLQELLGVSNENVRHEEVQQDIDVRVILGDDYKVRN